MSTAIVFCLGFLCFPILYGLLRRADKAAGAFIARREKYAAGHFVRLMDARLEAGKRTSCRPLLSTPPIRGRAYLLALFKEGPNEPPAEERVRDRVPFTEPLDDEDDAA